MPFASPVLGDLLDVYVDAELGLTAETDDPAVDVTLDSITAKKLIAVFGQDDGDESVILMANLHGGFGPN